MKVGLDKRNMGGGVRHTAKIMEIVEANHRDMTDLIFGMII